MATFGYTAPGDSGFPCDNSRALVSRFTLTEAADVSAIGLRLGPDSTGVLHVRGILLADAAGAPGAVLGTTAATTVAMPIPADNTVYEMPFSLAGLPAGNYWIGGVADNYPAVFNTQTGFPANSALMANGTFSESSPPAAWPGTDAGYEQVICAWVVYAPAGGGGGTPGDADGATVTAPASLVASAATGAATRAGTLLAATAALLVGLAAGAAGVNGQTLPASAALLPGTATAGAAGNAPSASIPVAASLLAGSSAGAATAQGAALTAAAGLAAGSAGGAASAAGADLPAVASLGAGGATGTAAVPGRLLPAAFTFLPGSAGNGGTAAGVTLVATSSLLPGAGSAGANGNAPGASLGAVASLHPGAGAGAGVARDALLLASANLIPGQAGDVVAGPAIRIVIPAPANRIVIPPVVSRVRVSARIHRIVIPEKPRV